MKKGQAGTEPATTIRRHASGKFKQPVCRAQQIGCNMMVNKISKRFASIKREISNIRQGSEKVEHLEAGLQAGAAQNKKNRALGTRFSNGLRS
ncbi:MULTISPECIES: hypothetical protein [unclassified Sinorhizobium]|uniref:hypothetical protein n=1 Tax=unclassified Sinorhizobium TaxID=2613772 RepID=UPI0035246614